MNQISFLFHILVEFGVQIFSLARNGKYISISQPAKADKKWTQYVFFKNVSSTVINIGSDAFGNPIFQKVLQN